jgi:hypothetical protein
MPPRVHAVHAGTVPLVSTPVHTPYINAYIFWNKLVLSYLLSRLLPQIKMIEQHKQPT